MVSISANIDKAAVDGINQFLNKIAEKSPEQLAKATKMTGIALCQSLRKNTIAAPKTIALRRQEYLATTKDVKKPPYLTYWKGKRLDKSLHRWRLTRKKGTPAESTHFYFVYTHKPKEVFRRRMGMRNGNYQGIVSRKIIPDLAAERRELLKYHGDIQHAGLAKQSWGWAAKGIYNGTTEDVSYKRRKHDRRDPRNDVSGDSKTWVTGKNSGTTDVTIENKIDYIQDAMKPGAVEQSVKSAIANMEWKFQDILKQQIGE